MTRGQTGRARPKEARRVLNADQVASDRLAALAMPDGPEKRAAMDRTRRQLQSLEQRSERYV